MVGVCVAHIHLPCPVLSVCCDSLLHIYLQDSPAQQTAAQELYSAVALELLQQAAKAMERTLLDGGPCRW